MTFVDEETAKGAAKMLQQTPVDVWSARKMLEIEPPETPDNGMPF